MDSIRKQNDDLRAYNLLVLENDFLQDMETNNHRWGKLEKHDVKKMYSYFILFNVSYNLYDAYSNNSIDEDVYKAQLDNTANTTYRERDFILQHVFPRGYKKSFCGEIESRWKNISESGTLLQS